jgi:hypothetical protein
VSSYLEEYGIKIIEPSQEHGKELPKEYFLRANIKRLNVKELKALVDSDNVSQHTKKLAFDELTNRNKTQVKKLRRGKHWRQRKWKRDLSGTAKGK